VSVNFTLSNLLCAMIFLIIATKRLNAKKTLKTS